MFLYSIYFYYKTLLIVIINVPIVNIPCSDDTGITRDSCVRTRRDQRTVAVGRALLLARALLHGVSCLQEIPIHNPYNTQSHCKHS